MSESSIFLPEKDSTGRLLLLSLFLSYITILSPVVLIGLLLIDIGSTFGYPVSMMGQIQTVCTIVEAIYALYMRAWSVKLNKKTALSK